MMAVQQQPQPLLAIAQLQQPQPVAVQQQPQPLLAIAQLQQPQPVAVQQQPQPQLGQMTDCCLEPKHGLT
jgi:hypothetical protein